MYHVIQHSQENNSLGAIFSVCMYHIKQHSQEDNRPYCLGAVPRTCSIQNSGCQNKIISELGSCVKVGVAILGSQSLTVLMVSVDVKQH